MVNKNIFLEAQTCLTRGWYLRSGNPHISLTQADQFRINEGIEIGKMAHALYPQGKLINEGSNINNHQRTQLLINDDSVQVIFEATFIYNENIAKADILERINGKWHLVEVKSSSASDVIKDKLIDDLAYTATILELCGITLEKTSLLLVSKNYRLGMDKKDFFVEVNCTEQVNKRRLHFVSKLNGTSQITGMVDRPEPKFIYQCKACDFYVNNCLGKNVDNPIFDLPHLNEKSFNKFSEEKISLVNQIPDEYKLTQPQKTVWTAVKNKKQSIDKDKLKQLLEKIIFPAYYLDFESVSTAIPLYQNIGPYQEIVTQYSLHKFSALNSSAEHFEFLADYNKDDRKKLAEKLLIDIGKDGSVVVYHAQAEKRFLNNLIKAAPEYTNELTAIIDRIVDLEEIIKKTYYHPMFHGSYSIKVVLPVLVPEMSYKNLVIGDGQSANVVFAELARGKYSTQEAETLCKELRSYCKQDTLAMVKIHEAMIALCRN